LEVYLAQKAKLQAIKKVFKPIRLTYLSKGKQYYLLLLSITIKCSST